MRPGKIRQSTLKGKFSLCLLVIVAVLLLTSGLLFGMMNYMQQRMETLLDINNRVYDLKLSVNEVAETYKYYLVSGREEDKEAICEGLKELVSDSAALKKDIFEDVYIREIDDLNNMIDTFSGQTEEGLLLFSSKNREERTADYEKAAYTAQLIDKYYDYVYRAVEQYSEMEKKALEKEKSFITGICIFVILVMFGGVTVMLFWFSKGVLNPLSRLAYKAANYRTDEPGQWQQGRDEVKDLTDTFDAMVLRIEEQMGQMEINMKLELQLKQQRLEHIKMEKLWQESEMKALQARINPHFMFNTLNSIAQMAYLEEAPQTEQMAEAVSDYFRYNLKDIHHVSTMEEEIKNVKDYVYIQKIRFGDRIDFSLCYDEKAGKGKIPALTLQPIIENSIIHGLGCCEGKGRVEISVECGEKDIRICISDNGRGMEYEKLSAVSAYLEGKDVQGIQSDSIGLKNVIDRMRAFFDHRFNMTIVSKIDEGTSITITVPYEENLCIKY